MYSVQNRGIATVHAHPDNNLNHPSHGRGNLASPSHIRESNLMAPPAAAPALKAVKMEPLVEQRHSLPRGTTPSSVIALKDETRTVKEDEDVSVQFRPARNILTDYYSSPPSSSLTLRIFGIW